MNNSELLSLLEKEWSGRSSIWFIPREFSSQQKKLVKQAQERLAQRQMLHDSNLYSNLLWFSSSGSTGKGGIKFFGHTRESLTVSALAVNKHLCITSKDRILNPLPLYHVGGFGTWLRARLSKSKWIDFSSTKWSPSKFYKVLDDEKVTVTSLVPTQVHDLVTLELACPRSLRAVVVGGGALSHVLYQSARRLGWPLLPSYGMTEFGSQIATADLDSLDLRNAIKNDIASMKRPPKAPSLSTAVQKFPEVRVLSHIKGIYQDQRGTFVQSEATCLYQLEVTPQGEFSLELKKRKSGVLVDDLIDFDPKTKVIKVRGRRTRVVKIKGELVSLDQIQMEFQEYINKAFETSSEGSDHGQRTKQILTAHFVIISSSHSRDENELVLVVELQSVPPDHLYFQKWLSLIKEFNSLGLSYKVISRLEFTEAFPRTPLGKVKLSLVRSAFDQEPKTS